jgi:hypothetical protein
MIRYLLTLLLLATTASAQVGIMTPRLGVMSVSSYSWTNAQVVAFGAVATGDLTMVTLPAKTAVINAYVIIDTAATQATTLTVACGRAGAAYIDYVVASDAKAAANTVYGDATVERGTNLTGYDIPSYTATTAVKCQFVAGTTLSTVLTSTGRLVLVTMLVP